MPALSKLHIKLYTHILMWASRQPNYALCDSVHVSHTHSHDWRELGCIVVAFVWDRQSDFVSSWQGGDRVLAQLH